LIESCYVLNATTPNPRLLIFVFRKVNIIITVNY